MLLAGATAAQLHKHTCCCEGPLGAVRVLDLPSWFTALPDMTTMPADALTASDVSNHLQAGTQLG